MAFLAGPWPARITWGLLPLLLGPALGDALGEHSLAVARTGVGAGVGDVGRRARRGRAADDGEPHRAAHRHAGRARRRELGGDHRATAGVAGGGGGRRRGARGGGGVLAADRRRVHRRLGLRRRAPVRAARARPRCSSARCRSPASARWRRRSPDRCCSPPSSGSPGASVLAVGLPGRGGGDPGAARAGPAVGGARARRARAARPARAGRGGAVPAGDDPPPRPGGGRRRSPTAATSPRPPSGWPSSSIWSSRR